jgi:CheY-like chemotaxis protein
MRKRILVVEDQEDNRQIIRDMLAGTDYEITEAENGEEALAVIAKERPNLILMDIQLPIMDGYEATHRIKADPANSAFIVAFANCLVGLIDLLSAKLPSIRMSLRHCHRFREIGFCGAETTASKRPASHSTDCRALR